MLNLHTAIDPHHNIIFYGSGTSQCAQIIGLTVGRVTTTLKEVEEHVLCTVVDIEVTCVHARTFVRSRRHQTVSLT